MASKRRRTPDELMSLFVTNARKFGFTKAETRELIVMSLELRGMLETAAFDDAWEQSAPALALEDTLPEARSR